MEKFTKALTLFPKMETLICKGFETKMADLLCALRVRERALGPWRPVGRPSLLSRTPQFPNQSATVPYYAPGGGELRPLAPYSAL